MKNYFCVNVFYYPPKIIFFVEQNNIKVVTNKQHLRMVFTFYDNIINHYNIFTVQINYTVNISILLYSYRVLRLCCGGGLENKHNKYKHLYGVIKWQRRGKSFEQAVLLQCRCRGSQPVCLGSIPTYFAGRNMRLRVRAQCYLYSHRRYLCYAST